MFHKVMTFSQTDNTGAIAWTGN